MNKIFSAVLVLAAMASFSSCVKSEEDDIFDKSAAERLNAASALYSQRLEASPNGWAMQLYPTTDNKVPFGNGYLVLCDFDEDKSVKVAMNNVLTNNVYAEDRSGWDVVTDNGPVLSFSTYNKVMHLFTNPEDLDFTDDYGENETGTGVGGDYEFIIVDAPEDASYMMLKGKKRGTYNLFTPIEEGVDYNEYLIDVRNFQNFMFPTDIPMYDVVTLGDKVYKMDEANDGIPNIYPFDGDAVIDETFNPFLITKRGDQYYLRFRDGLELEDGSKAQEFAYSVEEDVFRDVNNEECFISGPDVKTFFDEHLSEGKRWQMQLSDNMSDNLKTVIDALQAEMKNTSSKYEFDVASGKYGLSFYKSADGFQIDMDIKYVNKNKKFQVRLSYACSFAIDENGITIGYVEPMTPASTNMLSNFPKIGEILSLLSDTFSAKGATTNFNLSEVKMTSVSDAGTWCTFNYIK